MALRTYLRPRAYLYFLRSLLSSPKKTQVLPSSERPVFWTGSGGCGFLRVHDLLATNGQSSVFFKDTAKLQNHGAIDPSLDLVWERSDDESDRIQKYFAKHGVYDHHIAPYTLRYIREIIEHFEGKAVFLCLKSTKSVDSLWMQWGYRNPLVADRALKNSFPAQLFPDMRDVTRDSKAATQHYYDQYYIFAEECQAAYPDNFCIVDADKFFTDKEYFTSIAIRFNLPLEFKAYAVTCDEKTITTSLHGGIGNNLFQMAEPVAFCAEHSLPPPSFATWDMQDFPPSYRNDRFIGGHTGTPEELRSAFPHITWLPPTRPTFDYKFMLNDMYAFADVHGERNAILKYFEPSPEVREYIVKKYPEILGPSTVSLHHRAGWLPVDTHTFKPFGSAWYQQIFTEHFPEHYDCFVFSDKPKAGTELIEKMKPHTANKYHLVDENVFISLVMMSMCQNHVLSNSTLSFWGAYLDPRQPAGKTILHNSFTTYHSEPHVECRMIPYTEWKII